MANELQMSFAASATTVVSESADMADDALQGAAALLDNSSFYPLATATLHLPNGWVTAGPTAGTTVDLFMVRHNVDGTSDDSAEVTTGASGDPGNAEYVGSFLCTGGAIATEFRKTITISLTGVKAANFYIHNNTVGTLDYSASPITVVVHPFTWAPAT